MTDGAAWTVRLAAAAEADFAAIIRWTAEPFGAEQARLYDETLSAALTALRAGPALPGVKRRDEIGKDLSTLHVARDRRRGRHSCLRALRVSEALSLAVLMPLLTKTSFITIRH